MMDMTDGKKDDSASAPTRIREVRPAGKAMTAHTEHVPSPAATKASAGNAVSPTVIKGTAAVSPQTAAQPNRAAGFDPVVGWLVIVEGPGRGQTVNIHAGMNSLGRSGGQRIRVDFGDTSISGEGAAFITFEPKRQTFHLNHGGKANIVYLNDEPVLSPVPLPDKSSIAIGGTKFRFVQLCGVDFSWDDPE
jgi:hypothetical protein